MWCDSAILVELEWVIELLIFIKNSSAIRVIDYVQLNVSSLVWTGLLLFRIDHMSHTSNQVDSPEFRKWLSHEKK